MSTVSRILCALDRAESNRPVFDWALAVARIWDAHLDVLHAVPPDRPFGWGGEARAAWLAGLRADAARADVPLATHVQHGDPAGVIRLHAGTRRPDLLVLGTHGRQGWNRLRSGSVAERALPRLGCPALIVPLNRPDTDGAATAVRHVLYAVNDFGQCLPKLESLLALFGRDARRVSLVHVLPGTAPGEVPRHVWRFAEPEYRRIRLREAQRRLQAAVPAHVRRAVDVDVRVLTGGPDEAIARAATALGPDLVAVGSGPRGLAGLLRSTTALVVRASARPVLVLPGKVAGA